MLHDKDKDKEPQQKTIDFIEIFNIENNQM